ncbi:phosphoribosylglycinamide formyltransferase [Aliikangiella sp. G2MR2-5]|uniref:phosphoribosylglycinamide formyltransferase n=1 Tax=Aliikangiella sp. G2MR2-5 TaxID=2788943 RepID=UPI0018A993FA|nr:phosphoribosylglycinamide formyltransferase [Aliikangiella sp. G2MR2-5]
MNDKRVVVLISGSGSNLQAFIERANAGELGGQLVGVISNIEDAYGLTRAEKAGIETKTISHKSFESREAFDIALAESIECFNPDLVILAGFMRILTPYFVEKFSGRLLNIHPSLLPRYQGLHTHRRAMENGDEFHGTSVHFVTEELDGGPVIAQARLSLSSYSDEDNVKTAIQTLEHQLYPEVAQWFLTGRLELKAEGIYLDGKKMDNPVLLN